MRWMREGANLRPMADEEATASDELEPLPNPLNQLLEGEKKALYDWAEGYRKLHADADAGKTITAKQINDIDDKLNAVFENMKKHGMDKVRAVVEAENRVRGVAGRSSFPVVLKPMTNKQMEERQESLRQDYLKRRDKIFDDFLDDAEVQKIFNNTSGLVEAFRRQHVSPHPRRGMMPMPRDRAALVPDTLEGREGNAVVDYHASDKAPRFIMDEIDVSKKAKVETLYWEFERDHFRDLTALKPSELEQLAKDRSFGDLNLDSPEQVARDMNVAHADDVTAEWVRTLATMGHKDVRSVNMDKQWPAKNLEARLSMNHRIATTNFTWLDAITEDRKALVKSGKKPGKYTIFAGAGHFLGDGLLDEALNIRVIAFTRENQKPMPEMIRECSPNGPDVYLNGGEHHYDTYKAVRAVDMGNIAAALKKLDFLPGVPLVRHGLQTTADRYWDEVEDRPRFQSTDTKGPDAMPKAPNIPATITPRKTTR